MAVPATTADAGPPRGGGRWLTLAALLAVVAALFVVDLAVGSEPIPWRDLWQVLRGHEPSLPQYAVIVLDFRLPRALTAMLAGGALAVSGLQMQTLFRNPLAGPDVLGISSGASLGVAVVVLGGGFARRGDNLLSGATWLGGVGVVLGAALGAAAVLLVVLAVARRVEHPMTLLILGLMIGYATSAIVTLLFHFSIAENIQTYVRWTFGSFGGVNRQRLVAFAPVIGVGLVLAVLLVKPLNAMLLGEGAARALGLRVGRARLGIVASTALLAGGVTAYCGPIGFIGVAVPHLCRGLFRTADHRWLAPMCLLAGAGCALFADVVAQGPGTQSVLPLNAVTALLGAPVVAWVVLRGGHLREAFGE